MKPTVHVWTCPDCGTQTDITVEMPTPGNYFDPPDSGGIEPENCPRCELEIEVDAVMQAVVDDIEFHAEEAAEAAGQDARDEQAYEAMQKGE